MSDISTPETPTPLPRPQSGSLDPQDRPSIAKNSVARLLADGGGVVFGLVTGIITARWLGPVGKGRLSALLFLGALFVEVCALGLGEATVILLGKKTSNMREAIGGALTLLALSCPVGIILFILISNLQFGAAANDLAAAIVVGAVALPIATCVYVLTGIVNARERIIFTSAVLATMFFVTMVATWGLIVVVDLSVLGGALAWLIASGIGLAMLAYVLVRDRIRLRPTWNPDFIVKALRYGVVIELSYLLIALSSRVDQLLVFSRGSQADAGQYSISLTLGQLVIYAPFALSIASFPRTAHLEEHEVLDLTSRVARVALASALITGLLLVAAIPFATPLLFGDEYVPAVGPALILIIRGILWSEQWILSRAAVARGRTGLLISSFGLNVGIMVALDYLLIPRFGITGAAVSSVVSSAVGLLVCLVWYARERSSSSFRLRDLIPKPADFRSIFSIVGDIAKARNPRKR